MSFSTKWHICFTCQLPVPKSHCHGRHYACLQWKGRMKMANLQWCLRRYTKYRGASAAKRCFKLSRTAKKKAAATSLPSWMRAIDHSKIPASELAVEHCNTYSADQQTANSLCSLHDATTECKYPVLPGRMEWLPSKVQSISGRVT